MKIREKQMTTLEEHGRPQFARELAGHLREFAPKHSAVLGEERLLAIARSGIDRAAGYGLTKRGPVRFFLEMTFMFGSGFDTDPQVPWVRRFLAGSPADELDRADKMHEATVEYLTRVAGPQRQYAIEALRRIQRVRLEDFRAPGRSFEDGALAGLRSIYAEKCQYLGEAVVRQVIQAGEALARGNSATTDFARTLFVALTFALGHQFASDPLFPWIENTLRDEGSPGDGNTRSERLHAKSRLYLDRAVEYLESR